MKRSILILVMSIYLTPIMAQTGGNKIFNLNDCMQYAIDNSTKVNTQNLRNNNYRQDRNEAIASFLPSANISSSINNSYGRSIDPETNTYTNTSNLSNSYSVSSQIPVFAGLTTINSYRVSRAAILMGKEELERIKDEVALEVMQAYFDVVYYCDAVKLANQQLETSKSTYAKDCKLEELGLKSRSDILQIEAQLRGDEYVVIKQENTRDLAISSLKEKMNFPTNEEIIIDTNIYADEDVVSTSLENVISYAMENSPRIKSQNYSYRQSQLNYYIAKGRLLPSINIGGGYSTNFYENLNSTAGITPFMTQLKNNQGYYFGASLSIPIFNGLARRSNANRARNNMKIAEQTKIAAERVLQSEIEQNYHQMQGFRKEFIQTNKKVEAAELAHKATLQKYEMGLISPIELQTSANQLLQAKSELLNSRLQYIIKSRIVDYYRGESLIR
ncbi:MAG: TolC family protein [Bacteroidales bacterium]|nr:TolC family protein [Bacteroidales bacterium]